MRGDKIFRCIISGITALNIFVFCDAENMPYLEQLDFANGLFQRGLYDMAIAEYKEFIESFPGNEHVEDAYFGVAESYFFEKKYAEAASEYARYIELYPSGKKVPVSRMRIGQCFFFQNKFPEAVECLTNVEAGALDDTFKQVLYLYTARAYRSSGKQDDALSYFSKTADVINQSEYSAFALIESGDILLEKKENAAAIQKYKSAYQNAAQDKTKSYALHKEGEVEFQLGDYRGAADTFSVIVEKYSSEDIALSALANLMISLFNICENEKIASMFEKKAGMIPEGADSFDIFYITASAYSEIGRFDEALKTVDALSRLSGMSEEKLHKTLIKKAEILLKGKQYENVLLFIDQNLKGSKEDKDYITFMQAEANYGLGNSGKAFEFYNKVVNEYPKSSFPDKALYGMGYCQKSIGDDRKAIEFFVKYFNEGKESSRREEALYNAILLEAKQNMSRDVIEHSKLYFSAFPGGKYEEKILFRLGLVYSDVKEYSNAAEAFKRYTEEFKASPKIDEAYFELAYNLQAMGNTEGALRYYAKVRPTSDKLLFYSAIKNTALLYLNIGEDGKAAHSFSRILREFEENDLGIDVYFWLAKYYVENKLPEQALFVVDNAEKKDADKSHEIGLSYFKGEAAREKGNYNTAIEFYDYVIEKDKEGVFKGASRVGKGECLEALSQYDDAKKEFEAAIDENLQDNSITMRARFELAGIEELKGNLDEAYKLYMLVAILYNNEFYCAESLFKAGEIAIKLGRRDEAMKQYKEIVDKYPSSRVAKRAEERLKS